MPKRRALEFDFSGASEHALWVAERQSEGYFAVRAIDHCPNGEKRIVATRFIHNRSKSFADELTVTIARYRHRNCHVFYGVNSFGRPEAKARFANPSRLAHVDADKVKVPSPGPEPTRIVETSPGNYQFLYELDEALPREEVEAISKYLTDVVLGDKGGHSIAKLLRLPGTLNTKPEHNRHHEVRVIQRSGAVQDASTLLAEAKSVGVRVRTTQSTKRTSNWVQSSDVEKIHKKCWSKLDHWTRQRLRQRHVYPPFQLLINGKQYDFRGDDCSEITWGIASAFIQAGATPKEALAVTMATVHWRDRVERGKEEDPDQFIEKVIEADPNDQSATTTLLAVDPADWADDPVPERQWLVDDWIPMGKVTGLYGDGGAGKTLLSLQLCVTVALGLKFLGMKPREGRVYAFLAENDRDDSHITLDAICTHYGSALDELRGRVRIASRAGSDNILMSSSDDDDNELFELLLGEIKQFEPALVILDPAAHLFGANENDRAEVTQFIATRCQRIADVTGAAVVLCAHPSQHGKATDEGFSGSTAWNNAMRQRLYLRRARDDADGRILTVMKANYTRTGDSLTLTWRNGVFISGEEPSQKKQARHLEQRIVAEVAQAFEHDRPYSAYHQAPDRWIVHWMEDELKMTRKKARSTLRSLMRKKRIVNVTIDKHNHFKGLGTPEQATAHLRNNDAKQRNNTP